MAARSTIRVIVNGDIITSYDIEQRAKLLPLFGIKGGQKKATEELIDDTVKIQEGRQTRYRRSPMPRSTGLFASMGQERKMSPAQLAKELGRIGISPRTP